MDAWDPEACGAFVESAGFPQYKVVPECVCLSVCMRALSGDADQAVASVHSVRWLVLCVRARRRPAFPTASLANSAPHTLCAPACWARSLSVVPPAPIVLQETFVLNLTGSRLKKLKIQNLSQMNIKDFEHQRVRDRSVWRLLQDLSELLFCLPASPQVIMQAIRAALEAESGAGEPA